MRDYYTLQMQSCSLRCSTDHKVSYAFSCDMTNGRYIKCCCVQLILIYTENDKIVFDVLMEFCTYNIDPQ